MLPMLMAILVIGPVDVSTISRSEIENVVEQFIRTRSVHSAMEMIVEFRSVPERMVVAGRGYGVRVSESAVRVRAGNFSLPVEVVVDGRVDQRCIVSVKVRTFDSVLVTSAQLGRHEVLTPDMVRRRRVETTSLNGVPLTELKQLDGIRSSRVLSQGTVLTSDLTEPVPAVAQGSPVTLIVQGTNVRFSMAAIARQDGRKGERVSVQRSGSSARLHAVVVDDTTVQMTIH